jgi:tRNA U34 5-carboxymethylaminomethyl modifying GTPase MnmE/TrmE
MNPRAEEAPDQARTAGLAALVDHAAATVEEFAASGGHYTRTLAGLRERLVAGRLQVAVLGQFKRGKSSFLNAILGDSLLPTGVVPLTAVATFIRWAAAPSIHVAYLDGRPEGALRAAGHQQIREQLARFVTEEQNPRNRLGVARVELRYPAPLLRHGIVLIDTPGVGSTLRHNTDAAHQVLPECDAGFFVLSADPPVTETELDYLARARPHLARLFFVFNKIDYLAAEEREESLAFLRASLREHMPAAANAPIFGLSARQALAARQAGDAALLEESGLPEIEHHLTVFLAEEKIGSLQRAVAEKAGVVLDAALMDLALAIRALEMPVEDLEQRAAEFATALNAIERQRLVARDLLVGDQRRAVEGLEKQAAELRVEARRVLHTVVDDALAADVEPLETTAKSAIAEAIPQFFEARLGRLSRDFASLVDDILKGRVTRAEALIRTVRETAANLFEIPSVPVEEAEAFVVKREPYWVTQRWSDSLNPFAGGFVDRLLPPASRSARLGKRLVAEIDDLVERNVENLRWATLQNVDAAFRRFAAAFDERLAEVIAATRGAIDAAAEKRRMHADEADAELSRLRRGTARLQELREKVASVGQ